ncbi:hypothetical protein EWM64_g4979 [Hericium alpestre]|uniref:Fungal-type protein kinase domain-containing protein n=1 Tax=Hericium alpestre TaxID=135208 RepID=A0A4Y9ZXW2_9AGAM|nr:hypothetical protein EWM64_g4979 [Hericium alpestre]
MVKSEVKSSPSKAGTAAYGRDSKIVDAIKGPLAIDIMDHQLFNNIDELLACFLSFCKSSTDKELKGKVLLSAVQEKIKSVWNNPTLKDLVTAYCTVKGDERHRYEPFVKAFNFALLQLQEVNVDGLRNANKDLSILLHVNDPSYIMGDHEGDVSKRKPDIVLTSLAEAQRVSGVSDTGTWKELAIDSGLPYKKPREQFSWMSIFSSLEFKRTKRKLSVSPAEYRLNVPAEKHMKNVTRLEKPAPEEEEVEEPESKRLRVGPKVGPGAGLGVGSSSLLAVPVISSGGTQNDVAWIWWYDRTGAIQSEGINFVQDLPRFIVLLFAFQRFTLENWGINVTMDPGAKIRHTISQGTGQGGKSSGKNQAARTTDKKRIERAKPVYLPFELIFRESEVVITVDPNDVIYSSYALVGRATRVLGDRTSEFKILEQIMKHAQADTENVMGHVPEALYSTDILGPGDSIRKSEHVTVTDIWGSVKECSVRVLRATVFRRLEPITNLTSGEEFMKAWFQCVKCHYALWQCGVEHTDPSIGNLMIDPLKDNKGVLNDWDLATIRVRDKETLPHSERTGTPPFMALDLLTKAYYDGETPRLYRHDLEAFIWILPWVFLQYKNGQRAFNILRSWESADYRDVHAAKASFLLQVRSEYRVEEDSPFYNEWLVARDLIVWLMQESSYREGEAKKAQRPAASAALKKAAFRIPDFVKPSVPQVPDPEKEANQVYTEFWNVIADTVLAHPNELSYVFEAECMPRKI